MSCLSGTLVGRCENGAIVSVADCAELDSVCAGGSRLNDFIGHRPLPTLETQKIEPYANEWVRPIPLYIRDVGVACGPHREVVEKALQLLKDTDEELLRAASSSPCIAPVTHEFRWASSIFALTFLRARWTAST